MTNNQNYQTLTPDTVLNAVESIGIVCSGKLQILNSFENRVYLIGVENEADLIVKFYRPERWSDQQILEEHAFCHELAAAELPIVAPIKRAEQTLFKTTVCIDDITDEFRFAIFAKKGGRAPDLESLDTLEQLGTFLGRIHLVGQTDSFKNRPELNIQTYGNDARAFLLASDFIPADLRVAYETLTDDLLVNIQHCYQRAGSLKLIRSHADFHPGNILWTDDGPHIVDLDDCRTAPACQDLWMLLSGDRNSMTIQLDALLSGYTQFCDFDPQQLNLIEALRTLRLIHYYGWLAKRWEDPAFKIAFPWFNTQRCWEEHILHLREQAANLQEPALQWYG